jgi:hypothetical protein
LDRRDVLVSPSTRQSDCRVFNHRGPLRHGRNDELPGLMPLIAYVVLAPYLGAAEATSFVDGTVRETLDSRSA